jgi:prepilin signal peptidase PulO-like enzyme (type II secretory pathway)
MESSVITVGVDWHKTWEELGFFDKMKFFDIWFIIGVSGNFFQFIGAVVAILSESIDRRLGIFEKKETFIGFGAMFAWITMLKYL